MSALLANVMYLVRRLLEANNLTSEETASSAQAEDMASEDKEMAIPPVADGNYGLKPEQVEGAFWQTFFSQCRRVANMALARRFITREDCEGNEPFLYIGIPSITVLDAALRSMAPGSAADGIMLANKVWITKHNCPPKRVAFLTAMLQLKAYCIAAQPLTAKDKDFLYQRILKPDEVKSNGNVQLDNIFKAATGIGLQTTSEEQFKAHFNKLLVELGHDFIWSCVINQAFAVAEDHASWYSLEDLRLACYTIAKAEAAGEEHQPADDANWLGQGFLCLTIISAIQRSLTVEDGIKLAEGTIVSRINVPLDHAASEAAAVKAPGGASVPAAADRTDRNDFLEALLSIKAACVKHKLTHTDIRELKASAFYPAADVRLKAYLTAVAARGVLLQTLADSVRKLVQEAGKVPMHREGINNLVLVLYQAQSSV